MRLSLRSWHLGGGVLSASLPMRGTEVQLLRTQARQCYGWWAGILLATLVVFGNGAPAQKESVRDLFLKTRPTAGKKPAAQPATPNRESLGYSLYRRDPKNGAVRVAPGFRFRSDDAVFLVVESNADGYLYIFNREGQGPLRMIFPDIRISRGDSRIEAHVPLRVPDRDWFTFSGPLQEERVLLVFAREPVSGWPRGEELLHYPGDGFQLKWEQFQQAVQPEAEKIIDASREHEGKPLSQSEQARLGRGLKLTSGDPPPSVMVANRSKRRCLVVELVLKRR